MNTARFENCSEGRSSRLIGSGHEVTSHDLHDIRDTRDLQDSLSRNVTRICEKLYYMASKL
jgi:hypothetical protein